MYQIPHRVPFHKCLYQLSSKFL